MFGNFKDMMKQAQQMQFKVAELQEKFKDIEVQGEAGAGMVVVKMTCAGRVLSVQIDPTLLEGDKETLEDLVAAATNNATQVKDERVQQETEAIMGDMGLPAGMKLPF